MTHFRCLLDSGVFIGPQDLPVPKTVTISRAAREVIALRGGNKGKMDAVLYFQHAGKELPRKYKVPHSVMHGLSWLLGSNYEEWSGQSITLFATKCMCSGEVEECVRVVFPPDINARVIRWMKQRASPSAYMLPSEHMPTMPQDDKPNEGAKAPATNLPPAPEPKPAKPTDPERLRSTCELLRIAEECAKGLGDKVMVYIHQQLAGNPDVPAGVELERSPAMLAEVDRFMQAINQATTEAGDSGQETREATHAAIVAMIGGDK